MQRGRARARKVLKKNRATSTSSYHIICIPSYDGCSVSTQRSSSSLRTRMWTILLLCIEGLCSGDEHRFSICWYLFFRTALHQGVRFFNCVGKITGMHDNYSSSSKLQKFSSGRNQESWPRLDFFLFLSLGAFYTYFSSAVFPDHTFLQIYCVPLNLALVALMFI